MSKIYLFRATIIVTSLLFSVAGAAHAQDEADSPADADIQAVVEIFNLQVNAWNSGDIESFMEYYVKSDSLRFASGNTIQMGWDETLERYYRVYPDEDHMGTLKFDLLEKRKLAPEWILVFGRFHLEREEAIGNLQGLFTVLFHRYDEGWRIVADHTSSE